MFKKGLFKTETPLQALENEGIHLPEMTNRGLSYSCNMWQCEICGQNNAYLVKRFSLAAYPVMEGINFSTATEHRFCSNKCQAIWMVKTKGIPLTFWERSLRKIFGTPAAVQKWWQKNITNRINKEREKRTGHLATAMLLKNGYEHDIHAFYVKYLDTTILDNDLAKEFPDGLLMIALSKDLSIMYDAFEQGTRFLVKWTDILFFSKAPYKTLQIYPHKKTDLKRKIKLSGSEMPGSIDKIPFLNLPLGNPGIKISIPYKGKIVVKIGIRRYAALLNNTFVSIDKACDPAFLLTDEKERYYLRHNVEIEWGPDTDSKETYEYQLREFLKAARIMAKIQEEREIGQLLVNGDYDQETKEDIDLFYKDWRQWMTKHSVK